MTVMFKRISAGFLSKAYFKVCIDFILFDLMGKGIACIPNQYSLVQN